MKFISGCSGNVRKWIIRGGASSVLSLDCVLGRAEVARERWDWFRQKETDS